MSIASQTHCVHCGTELTTGARFCHCCGKPVLPSAQCGGCGRSLAAEARFCHACGLPVSRRHPIQFARFVLGLIVALTCISCLAWCALLFEVETVLVSGPLIAAAGLILLVLSSVSGFVPGVVLALGALGICGTFVLTVELARLSPQNAKVPFLLMGMAYLVVNAPLTRWAWLRVPRYVDPDRCVKCGYLLRGLTEPRCPECGTPFVLQRYSFPVQPLIRDPAASR